MKAIQNRRGAVTAIAAAATLCSAGVVWRAFADPQQEAARPAQAAPSGALPFEPPVVYPGYRSDAKVFKKERSPGVNPRTGTRDLVFHNEDRKAFKALHPYLLNKPSVLKAIEPRIAPGEDAKVAVLVKRLVSLQPGWQERSAVEKMLEDMPFVLVLPALIPEASKGMPESVNGVPDGLLFSGFPTSAEENKNLPPNWQVYHAVGRLWSHHWRKIYEEDEATRDVVGRRLIEYLPNAPRKSWVLEKLGTLASSSPFSRKFWLDEAEAPVLAIFRDAKTNESTRASAMQCLLANTGRKYYDEMKVVVRAYPESTQRQLYFKADRMKHMMSVGARYNGDGKLSPQVDNEILGIAFSLLPKMEKTKEGGGYFLALDLGRYLGLNFQADQKDPKYKGETRLTPSFFSDTTANALEWWALNQSQYK